MVEAREAAPAAVDPGTYLDAEGEPDRDRSINGPTAAAIPGEPAGLAWIAGKYGRLPLSKSLAPAIRIAREGFKPDPRFLGALSRRKDIIARYPGSAELLLVDGAVPT